LFDSVDSRYAIVDSPIRQRRKTVFFVFAQKNSK
jgi:hypothetical protein